jgi:membrane glycosyltransferase
MAPILLGLVLSIPLSYFTGSISLGSKLRDNEIFVTPEEGHQFPVLAEIAAAVAARRDALQPPPGLRTNLGLLQAVLDPYVNAVHVSLLREKDEPPPMAEERFASLRATLLRKGPKSLSAGERRAILFDADSMHRLHHEVWATPSEQLADWWKTALEYYTLLAPAPQTAFSG